MNTQSVTLLPKKFGFVVDRSSPSRSLREVRRNAENGQKETNRLTKKGRIQH